MRTIKSDWKVKGRGEGRGGEGGANVGGFHSINRILVFCPVAFGVNRDV